MTGLRARKKRETAERIAQVAAELFSARGYEAVSVVDVARAADVSEQTVYNHFPTKEDLVFDRAAEFERALAEAVAARAPGTPAADAVAGVVGVLLDSVAAAPTGAGRGGMPRLAADSAGLRRGLLERTRRQAAVLARALAGAGEPSPEDAIVAWALAGVFELTIEEIGAAHRAGEAPSEIAARLRPLVKRRVAVLRPLG